MSSVLSVKSLFLGFSDIPTEGWKVEHGYQGSKDPIFASVLSIPIMLSFLFLIPHWWKTEKTTGRRLKTLPLLLLQLWPQYRVFRLMIILCKGDQEKYCKKKEQHDRDVTCLGRSIQIKLNFLLHNCQFHLESTCFNFQNPSDLS